jgi:hypothetical protein
LWIAGLQRKITLKHDVSIKMDSLWKEKIIKEFKPDVVIDRWFCQRTIIENGQHDGIPTVIKNNSILGLRIT